MAANPMRISDAARRQADVTVRTLPVVTGSRAAVVVRTAPVNGPAVDPVEIVDIPLGMFATIHLGAIRAAAHRLGVRIVEVKLGRGRHDLVAVGTNPAIAELSRLVAPHAIDLQPAPQAPDMRPGLLRRIAARIASRIADRRADR